VSYWTFIRRTLTRNPFRTTLTVSGIAVAVVTFIALRTIVDAWNTGAEYAAKDRLSTRHKVSYGLPLPKHYAEEIATRVPGVVKVTYCDWFGGRWAKAPNEFFANVACAANAFDVYPEIEVDPLTIAAWKQDKQGAVIGDLLAKRLGLHAGDHMTLQGSFYPGDWELHIVGTYTALPRSPVDRSTLFFRWDYKNERVPERQRELIGWLFTRVDEPASSARVSRAIDRLFDDRDVRTATMSERAANGALLGGMSAVLSALDIVSLIVLTIMTLILGNTIAMAVREHTAEYGVLLALGFEPRHVGLLIAAEAIALSFAGGTLGLGLAFPLVQLGIGQWLEVNVGKFFPVFRISLGTTLTAAALTLFLGALAATLPALRVGRMSVVDAIRRPG
jgi:putative ABC transport system permease protein